ncbi:MAG: phosphatidate cytidylyltransferase [Methylobacteriaceae bacterium]|nr:phosphatidate cytidylyltransferase [Methylobacteriaceae bacterium]
MADLGPRVASGVVMIAAALTTAWLGGRWFTLFWLAAGLAIHWEWQRLIGGSRQGARFAVGAAALAAMAAAVDNAAPDIAVAIAVASALAMAALAGQGLRIWAGAGALYAAALVISVLFLRGSLFAGFEAILWLFATVWGTDVMAYFGGRIVGGPKLWPRVSPSKTWSGFLIGVFCGALAGMAVAPHNAAVLPLFAFTALAAALSQGGDLFESSVKRHFGVKDASRLIPGHGGVMDRLDGFIAAAAFAALVAFARAGYASPAQSLFFW